MYAEWQNTAFLTVYCGDASSTLEDSMKGAKENMNEAN